uniref:Uncharacterized protein n=1 Tax=Cercocebus atys TaxID=9531 RepID=A0A2K5LVD0_CERAT
MERFVVTAPPARNRSKTALYVTPLDRVTEFGGELDHLKSKTHTRGRQNLKSRIPAFLSRHVKNGGSIPKSDQLGGHLPDGYENENQLLNSQDC